MFTKGAQCTGNFVFTDARRPRLRRVRRALRRPRRGHRHQRLPDPRRARSAPGSGSPRACRVATAGTTVGRGTAGLQLVDQDAPPRAQRRPGLRLQRLRAGAGRPRRSVRQGEPLGPVLGRTQPARPGQRSPPAARSTRYGNSRLRGGAEPLSPKTGAIARPVRRRLGLGRLHRDPRHPRRLGQRLPRRPGPRLRHAVDGRGRPAAGLQRPRRPRPRAALRPAALRHRRAAAGRRHEAGLDPIL